MVFGHPGLFLFASGYHVLLMKTGLNVAWGQNRPAVLVCHLQSCLWRVDIPTSHNCEGKVPIVARGGLAGTSAPGLHLSGKRLTRSKFLYALLNRRDLGS